MGAAIEALGPAAPVTPTPAPRRRWEWFSLAGLLGGTALVNLWGLAASGWANSFYAAAGWAGTRSWKALLFGAFDPAGFITVDKPPASIWLMGLSGRLFGFSSWSMLVPEALLGVASVALLYAAVRRVAGPAAGLLAGVAFALTPVAVLMFRFNNPDALLVLLLVLAAYCVTRAIERAGTRWLVLAGVAIGFAVLTKLGAALLVLPGLALAYLLAAPTGWWRRVRQLLAGGVALLLSAGWYLALVAIWPAADRPYIGGSRTNSLLELALDYNGVSRLLGRSGGAGGGAFGPGGGHFGGFGGAAGASRLFAPAVGGQVSWLLPAALALLPIGLWLTRRAPRTDPTRAALLLWGGWLLVSAAVFSFMAGIFHPYYTVALAPAVAAVIGIGGRELVGRRSRGSAGSTGSTGSTGSAGSTRSTGSAGSTRWAARGVLAVLVAGTGGWAWVLLDRTPTWLPALRWAVLALTAAATLAVLVTGAGRRQGADPSGGGSSGAGSSGAGSSGAGSSGGGSRSGGRVAAGWVVPLVVVAGLLGPAAYAVQTALTPHTSGLASAGPSAGGFGGGPGRAGRTDGDRARNGQAGGQSTRADRPGGLGSEQDAQVDPAATGLLRAAGTTWSAATISARGASSLELSSDTAVMAIGGFMGSDPAPTPAQFQADVAAGRIHYFVAEAPRGGPGHGNRAGDPTGTRGGRDSRDTANQISTWVSGHFAPITVAGQTWYDLTRPLP
ncbi:MAG TPA: glycosyltransferase family 39 protein [Pseudonocardia sp.]|nr:glycosyltransferase family 39 protein [Pseudonocardia sp.]